MRSPEKFTISLFTLILLLTACEQRQPSTVASDADFQKKLVGTWVKEDTSDGEQWRTVTVISPDGGYFAEGTIVASNEIRRFSEAGTILVRGGLVIETMTKHSKTNARVPSIIRMRIVRLDDRELVMQDEARPDVQGTFRREK